MTSLEGTLSNARARVASLRFWGNTFVDNYDAYAADHASCPGFVSVRADVVAARDDVRAFATTIEERLDDSGWVTEIGDRLGITSSPRPHARQGAVTSRLSFHASPSTEMSSRAVSPPASIATSSAAGTSRSRVSRRHTASTAAGSP